MIVKTPDNREDIVKRGNRSTSLVYNDSMHSILESMLVTLRKIEIHLQIISGEEIKEEDL